MNLEVIGFGIVLIGNFNPKIFQPAWFAANDLIRQQEADEVDPEVIHADITIFKLDWCKIEVTRERFNAFTSQEPYFEVFMDLILSTFELLRHTPIGQLGINPNMHYRLKNEADWHKIGDTLAPKDPWSNLLENPGMDRIRMSENRMSGPKGYFTATVEPSRRFRPGLYFGYNDHYEIEKPQEAINCEEIIEILRNRGLQTLTRSREISEQLINNILEG